MRDLKAILSNTDYEAVVEFKRKLSSKLGDALIEIKIFGSKVKKQDNLYSDLDIIIILDQVDSQHKDLVFDVAVDINLKFDVVISPIIYSNTEYTNDLFKETYFYKTTHNEGIKI